MKTIEFIIIKKDGSANVYYYDKTYDIVESKNVIDESKDE